MTLVHYMNQFFAGAGGEDQADTPPFRHEGAVGPGRGLGLPIDLTLACGDDYFAEHEDEALATLLTWLEEAEATVLICGPAFGSGRYGYACGVVAREAAHRGVPAVAAMHPDNPGVLAADGAAYVVPTGTSVTGMREALPRVAALAGKLARGEPVGTAAEEGYLPRHMRQATMLDRPGADRAIELLLLKLGGEVRTEAAPPSDFVTPPPPIADASTATIALVTEAGCVPQGNPDHLPSRRAHTWLKYSLDGVRSLSADRYETVHGGFDTADANEDPNRLVPLDAARQLEESGRIGRLHDSFYTTSGVNTPVAVAAKMGQEIAEELVASGVQAVILTGT
jgi:glycine reductase complex component B subunit gamma